MSHARIRAGSLAVASLLAALAVGMAPTRALAEERFVVDDIRIEGLRRFSPSSVFVDLPIDVGDTVDARTLRVALRQLFLSENFEDIRFLRDDDALVVVVEERPFIARIDVDGNRAIKTEDLLQGFMGVGLATGRVLKRTVLESVTSELQRQYNSQGRYDADVVVEVIASAGNQVAVKIDIDEGSASRIQAIRFIGNQSFSDAVLLEQFDLRARRRFPPWQSGRSKYSRNTLQGDLEKLESWYFDRGFLRFSIDSVQVSLSPDYESVYITVNMEEGSRYTVNEVRWVGELALPKQQLTPFMLVAAGQQFSRARVTASEERIVQRLGVAGYHYAEVRGVTEIDDDSRSVKLRFHVDAGRRTYVNRIEFVGNSRTNDNVLRREMRQLERSPAALARIERSKLRLERLGFFSSVEFDAAPVPGSEDMVDLLFAVEEQPSASIGASIGYAQSQGLLLGINLDQANFFGTGQRLSLNVRASDLEDNYAINWVDPYYTVEGVSRSVGLRYRTLDFSAINVSNYATTTFGGSLGFGYPVNETTRLSLSMSVEKTKIVTGDFAVQEISSSPRRVDGITHYYAAGATRTFTVSDDLFVPLQPGFVDVHGSSYDNVAFTLGWSQSRLNRGQLATRGYAQQFSLEFASPIGELQYFKVLYDGQYFLPFGNSGFTLRLHTRLGYGDGYGGVDRLPFFNHFFLGGYSSVRGFRLSSLGPRNTPARVYQLLSEASVIASISTLDDTADVSDPCGVSDDCYFAAVGGEDVALGQRLLSLNSVFGGNVLVLGNVELLLPLPFLPDSRAVRAALFFDVGNVFDTECTPGNTQCYGPRLNELRRSVGVGFTWLTAVGALTFSWAKPYNTDQFDRVERFQFNIGSGFNY